MPFWAVLLGDLLLELALSAGSGYANTAINKIPFYFLTGCLRGNCDVFRVKVKPCCALCKSAAGLQANACNPVISSSLLIV